MTDATPVAFVTGASRGIGKACALALAQAGFDVAISARTLHEGEGRDDSDSGQGRAIVGSLEATAEDVQSAGRRALPVVADLMDRSSLLDAAARVLSEWGRVDVLVNNAVHTGPGSMVRLLDTPIEALETKLAANVVAQLVLTKAVLPAMLDAGGGTVINMTSHAGYNDPPAPVGKGGWGYAYAASKGAFHRMAAFLHVELGEQGIRAYNVDPGNVTTERAAINDAALGLAGHYVGAPPSAIGTAVAWLATSPEAAELSGTTVLGQRIALKQGHPDWRPPRS